MIKLGYKREAFPIMKEHAKVLCNMARHSTEKEILHTYYLQSLMVLREGVNVAEETFRDTLTLTSLQEVKLVYYFWVRVHTVYCIPKHYVM